MKGIPHVGAWERGIDDVRPGITRQIGDHNALTITQVSRHSPLAGSCTRRTWRPSWRTATAWPCSVRHSSVVLSQCGSGAALRAQVDQAAARRQVRVQDVGGAGDGEATAKRRGAVVEVGEWVGSLSAGAGDRLAREPVVRRWPANRRTPAEQDPALRVVVVRGLGGRQVFGQELLGDGVLALRPRAREQVAGVTRWTVRSTTPTVGRTRWWDGGRAGARRPRAATDPRR